MLVQEWAMTAHMPTAPATSVHGPMFSVKSSRSVSVGRRILKARCLTFATISFSLVVVSSGAPDCVCITAGLLVDKKEADLTKVGFSFGGYPGWVALMSYSVSGAYPSSRWWRIDSNNTRVSECAYKIRWERMMYSRSSGRFASLASRSTRSNRL
jgi:hypothetical protein